MSFETKARAAAAYRIYDWLGAMLREQAAQPQRRPPLGWIWRASLGLALVLPLLLLALAAAQNYRLEQQQAETRVMHTVGELHEQTLKVFETYELVLAWVDDRIRGLDWDQIAHDEGLHRFLVDLQSLPQIRSIEIVGPQGQVEADGSQFPAAANDVSSHEYFAVQKVRGGSLVIERQPPASAKAAPGFVISRRRTGGRAVGFDGIVSIAGRPGYLTDFYGTIARIKGYSVALLRSDGAVLAGWPSPPAPADFSAGSALMRAIAQAPAGGVFRTAGDDARIWGYRHVKGLPLYVVFGFPAQAVVTEWRGNLYSFALFAVPAALALFGLMLFAARQLQQQQLATARWRTTAQRLKTEFDRRTEVEAELRQAQKMEALGQLTGGVAHDFNNLLTVLQVDLELLDGKQRDAALQGKVEQALRTVDRGARLTHQLLAFARRQPLWLEAIDVNALIRGMDELLARTVGAAVTVATDLAPDLWPAQADATQLELALLNLAINARDAMPTGGTLRIRTGNATLPAGEGEPGGDFVAIEAIDTGAGMTPEVMARAFEPFFTTKGPDRGTGLGLSMVYGFVRQAGGRAAIESAIGRGTTIRLHLPRDAAGAAPDATR